MAGPLQDSKCTGMYRTLRGSEEKLCGSWLGCFYSVNFKIRVQWAHSLENKTHTHEMSATLYSL